MNSIFNRKIKLKILSMMIQIVYHTHSVPNINLKINIHIESNYKIYTGLQ